MTIRHHSNGRVSFDTSQEAAELITAYAARVMGGTWPGHDVATVTARCTTPRALERIRESYEAQVMAGVPKKTAFTQVGIGFIESYRRVFGLYDELVTE